MSVGSLAGRVFIESGTGVGITGLRPPFECGHLSSLNLEMSLLIASLIECHEGGVMPYSIISAWVSPALSIPTLRREPKKSLDSVRFLVHALFPTRRMPCIKYVPSEQYNEYAASRGLIRACVLGTMKRCLLPSKARGIAARGC